jgi:hypothetical protein
MTRCSADTYSRTPQPVIVVPFFLNSTSSSNSSGIAGAHVQSRGFAALSFCEAEGVPPGPSLGQMAAAYTERINLRAVGEHIAALSLPALPAQTSNS